jgi:hypothetical protein
MTTWKEIFRRGKNQVISNIEDSEFDDVGTVEGDLVEDVVISSVDQDTQWSEQTRN